MKPYFVRRGRRERGKRKGDFNRSITGTACVIRILPLFARTHTDNRILPTLLPEEIMINRFVPAGIPLVGLIPILASHAGAT